MVRKYLVLILALATIAPTAFAGITGILAGKVTDADGKPVPGVTIRVLGTTRGGISQGNGKFTIINVNAGTYSVRATAVGYDTVLVNEVDIVADQTKMLNISMSSGELQMKEVVITADRDMVRTSDLGTARTQKGDDLVKIGRDNVASALSLNAGIRAEGTGFNTRGSRTAETQVLVDGLTMTDQFTGGLGNSGATVSAAMPSPLATEEVSAQTGGFGAEYGNAVGGIVNTVVRTGRTDRFEGQVRWRKDVPFLWGVSGNGYDAGTPLEDVVDVTFGGPLGFNRSTFFVAVRNTFQNHRNFGLQVEDPIQNNLGQMPNNRTWSRNITARMKFQLSDQAFLQVGGLYGLVNGERGGWGWLYMDQPGVLTSATGTPILDANGNTQSNGFVERSAKQIVVQEFSTNAFAMINHTLGSNTNYQLRASYNSKTTETGKRVTPDAPDIFSGWELHQPVDNLIADDTIFVAGQNRIIDSYESLRRRTPSADGFVQLEFTQRNPITGFVEGPADVQSTKNPYGVFNFFAARGNEGGIDFRTADFIQLDGNITHNLEVGETRHVFKAGFELRLLSLKRHQNGNPWDGSPFYDVYGTENLYFDADVPDPAAAKAQTEQPYDPITAGIFFQDQIQFQGLSFTPGLRVDYLDPNALYRTETSRFIPFGSSEGFATSEAKFYFSPRLTITYPVSDNGWQNFKLAYGIYYQATPWADYYDSFNTPFLRGGQALGNPNMEMQRTNQYEISYNHQLTSVFAVTLTGYYKDIYNQSDLAFIRAVPNPFYQRVMSAYGNSKGLEITLDRRTSDNWGFNLNYTLSAATGTANNSSTIVALDPYTDQPAFPVEPFPLGFDRTHRVNAVFNLAWGAEEGPRIAGVPFLEHFNINLSGFWQTGAPYTPVNLAGQAIGALNSGRFPAFWNSDLRIIRNVPLQKILGGNTSIDLILDVTNMLNFTDAVSFFTTTGNPDNNGTTMARVPGDFPVTSYYRDADPKNKVTMQPEQYDRVGERLYSAFGDTNGDGIQTAEESYAGYQRYIATVEARRVNNYQYPRAVYFAIGFRF